MKIDVDVYREELEGRLLGAGLVKLDEPADSNECFHISMHSDTDSLSDFSCTYWQPAIFNLLGALKMSGVTEFYTADVYYEDNGILIVTVSRGDTQRDPESR